MNKKSLPAGDGETWSVTAPAKLNLSLDVLARRADGYHDLRMLMISLPPHDRVTLSLTNDGLFTAASTHPAIPRDLRNIALRAAALYLERNGQTGRGARLHIDKKIPVSAGLGGGSGDAAAVLRLLNEQSANPVSDDVLEAWGLELGSDVPYCLRGGLCLAEGQGERLSALPPLPPCHIVLCTPPVAVSTRAVFSRLQIRDIRLRPDWKGLHSALESRDLPAFARRMYNVLEPMQAKYLRDLPVIRAVLLEQNALGAMMSGTGPSMFGLFDNERKAADAFQILRKQYPNTFLTKTE